MRPLAEVSQHLTARGILESLEPSQIQDLEKIGVYMEYQRELVTADGDTPGFFFYILEGDFEVSKIDAETKKKVVLASIGPGQCFGEMSFLTGAPASANVTALDRVICWAVPYDQLRKFIETQACGSRLALQIAGLLARRVQEGNTRLLGLNSTLSAYFGNLARQSTATSLEGPRSQEHAEMELHDDLFVEFARQTLGLSADAPLSDEQKIEVQRRIESNEVDIVPWLEQGQRGQPLKVRLKFVSEDIPPTVAVNRSAPIANATSTIVRVPQVRARITPTVAYSPIPQSPFWQWARLIIAALLILLTLAFAVSLIPLRSRENIAQSESVKSLPFQAALHRLFFREQTQIGAITLKKGESYGMQFTAPKIVRVELSVNLPAPLVSAVPLRVILFEPDKEGPSLIEKTVEIPAGITGLQLLSTQLPAGHYELKVACDGGNNSAATFTVKCLR